METRVNCKVQMQVKKDKLGGYEESRFVLGHCHPPTVPHKRFMLRSHRYVPKSTKRQINAYDSANI